MQDVGRLLLVFGVLLAIIGASTQSATQVCTSTASINSKTRATGSHTICTQAAGIPVYQQLLLGALSVLLFVAPIVSAVYLARRSRRLVPA